MRFPLIETSNTIYICSTYSNDKRKLHSKTNSIIQFFLCISDSIEEPNEEDQFIDAEGDQFNGVAANEGDQFVDAE